MYVDGRKVGEVTTRRQSPQAQDKGHSVIRVDTVVDSFWRVNVTVHCQCGKKRSSRAGFAPAMNSLNRHRRDEARKAQQ